MLDVSYNIGKGYDIVNWNLVECNKNELLYKILVAIILEVNNGLAIVI